MQKGKSRILTLMVVMLLASVIASCGVLAASNSLQLSLDNEWVNGEIAQTGDVNTYAFSLAQSSHVKLTYQAWTIGLSTVSLWNEDMTTQYAYQNLIYSTESTPGNRVIEQDLPAGTYLFRVAGVLPINVGSYRLRGTAVSTASASADTGANAAGSLLSFVGSAVSPTNPGILSTIISQITSAIGEKDQNGSSYYLLKAKGTAKSKTSIKLTWNKIPTAKQYIIYGNRCGRNNRYVKIKTTTQTSYTQTKLKSGKYYKYLVVAVNGGNVLATSKTIHVATNGGKVGNTKSVTVKKTSVTIKKGKTSTIKASTVPESSKLTVKQHRALAYESSNPAIASVSKKGVITGIAKGTCYVYVYAQNGVYKRIRVTVK